MKFLRIGIKGKEKPAVLDKDGKIRDLSSKIKDFSPEFLNNLSINNLKNYQFIENLNDALDFLKRKKFNGQKVIFGSHYIAKYVYSFFDFSFDKDNI